MAAVGTQFQTILTPAVSDKSEIINHSYVSGFTCKVKPCNLVSGLKNRQRTRRSSTVVAAVGDVSSDGTAYLIGGAIAVALIGTAFPIFFSRKDL